MFVDWCVVFVCLRPTNLLLRSIHYHIIGGLVCRSVLPHCGSSCGFGLVPRFFYFLSIWTDSLLYLFISSSLKPSFFSHLALSKTPLIAGPLPLPGLKGCSFLSFLYYWLFRVAVTSSRFFFIVISTTFFFQDWTFLLFKHKIAFPSINTS